MARLRAVRVVAFCGFLFCPVGIRCCIVKRRAEEVCLAGTGSIVMNRNAKIVAGVASAVVGTACLVALVKAVSQPASPKKSKRKGKKSKRSKKDKSKSSSQGTTRELVFKIERECIAEFKAYLPKLGEKEASLFQQVQAGGRQLTQEVAEQIQGTLIQELETHLEKFKKALCEKYSCSESKHDKLVQKLLEDKDPEIMKLMEESQKLWAIFKPREAASMEVPEHIDEDAAIAYITRSFKLVTAAMAESRKQFVKDDGGNIGSGLKAVVAAYLKVKA